MKNRIGLILLAVMLALSVSLIGCGPSYTLTMVSTSGGNVSVMREGTADWTEAQVGISLEPGDIIKSGGNSSAEITFLDGSTIELEAGTEVEVISLDVSADTDSITIKLKQTIGSIIFRVTKIVDPASRYEVETPASIVVIRGSAVRITVAEDGTTRVCNLEGDIWAIAQGVELQIPEGECCVVRPGQPPELEVIFTDPNLEAVIREAVGKPTGDIYPSDLEGLTSLDARERNITDLAGLERCTSLTYLSLEGNQISDISPLANLTSLTGLGLSGYQIADISPLVDLTRLTWLSLYDTQISDISPLAKLTSLTSLHLDCNQISHISPLANLTSLTFLNLDGNQISDISPLANLTNLTGLNLGGNQISNISPLANLTSLTDLSLGDNQISDISPLANLTSLTRLYLWSNQISDISPLANFTNLTDLDLNKNGISNISSLANLTNLIEVTLNQNQISDISPLVQNAGLGTGDEVYLEVNPLSSDSINVYIPQLEARGVTVIY